MGAAPEDCPCCDADAADMDGSMIQGFLSGYIAGRKGLKVPGLLCDRHMRLANSALEFVAEALKKGGIVG